MKVIVVVKVLAWDALTLVSKDELGIVRIKARVSYSRASRILSVLEGSKGLIYS